MVMKSVQERRENGRKAAGTPRPVVVSEGSAAPKQPEEKQQENGGKTAGKRRENSAKTAGKQSHPHTLILTLILTLIPTLIPTLTLIFTLILILTLAGGNYSAAGGNYSMAGGNYSAAGGNWRVETVPRQVGAAPWQAGTAPRQAELDTTKAVRHRGSGVFLNTNFKLEGHLGAGRLFANSFRLL